MAVSIVLASAELRWKFPKTGDKKDTISLEQQIMEIKQLLEKFNRQKGWSVVCS